MKITVDILSEHGFRNAGGFFIKNENMGHVSIRQTKGNDSWQLAVFRKPSETYERFYENIGHDDNSMSFLGCVTDYEQIKDAMIVCGLAAKTKRKKRT